MPTGIYERTPEHREKLRQTRLARPISAETREKMRQAAKRRWADPKYQAKRRQIMLRRWRNPEYREFMHQLHLGKKRPPETRQKMHGKKRSFETREKDRQARLRRSFPLTDIERILLTEFKKRRLKFEMHKAMFGRWQPDFIFEDAKLIVQADGDYWHNRRNPRNAPAVSRDDAFNAKTAAEGWTVFRFSNTQINAHAAACARAVARFVRDHRSNP